MARWRVRGPNGESLSVEAESQDEAIAKGQQQSQQPDVKLTVGGRQVDPYAETDKSEIRQPSAWQGAQATATNALEKIGMQPGQAQSLAEFVIPGSNTEAGIQAATMLAPGVGPAVKATGLSKTAPAIARNAIRAGRVGLEALGGGVGGAMDPNNTAASGAGQGALVGTVGEVLATPIQWLMRAIGSGVMPRLDAQRLGKVANEINDALPKTQNVQDLNKIMAGATGHELIGQQLRAETDPIKRAVQGNVYFFPTLDQIKGARTPVTFEGALKELEDIGQRGWMASGDPRGAMQSSSYRQLRHNLRQEITDALEHPQNYGANTAQGSQAAAQAFDRSMIKYSRGREVVDALGDPSVWEGGRLNMNALQKLVGTDEMRDVEKRLGPEFGKFLSAVFRGGNAVSSSGAEVRDKAGAWAPHLRMYPTSGLKPHLGLSAPGVPSWVGPDVPGVFQKGASAAPAVSFTASGLARQSGEEPKGQTEAPSRPQPGQPRPPSRADVAQALQQAGNDPDKARELLRRRGFATSGPVAD